ncbi:MAG: hypothetical protein ABI166_06465 [Mucilaginibacter sp.]
MCICKSDTPAQFDFIAFCGYARGAVNPVGPTNSYDPDEPYTKKG